MRIDELLDKYFEGNTSSEEEKELRAFFSSADIPLHLAAYKPMFAYFDQEIAKTEGRKFTSVRKNNRLVTYMLSGVAAAILLILGIRSFYTSYETRFCSENYVVINGRCYTDIHKVREIALETLREVAKPAEDYFPDKSGNALEKEAFEMQLKELGTLFNEE